MSLVALIQDVATALAPIKGQIADLSIYAGWWDVPTPPALDVYPSTPFQTFTGMSAGNNQVFLTVRARASMGDVASGQATLLRMLDPSDPASVEKALEAVEVSIVSDGVSGFTVYADDAPSAERMIGCEWKVTTLF